MCKHSLDKFSIKKGKKTIYLGLKTSFFNKLFKKLMYRSVFILGFLILLGMQTSLGQYSQNLARILNQDPTFLKVKSPWIDSTLARMTTREKIGQLLMVAAYSNKGQKHIDNLAETVLEYKIGGLIFFKGNPNKQVAYTNELQHLSKIPMLIAMDAEWGLSMRLDSTQSFPRQLALGAVRNNNLLYEFGNEIGRECKRMGVHINFAPVIDVNNNPLNPVINDRSFGENIYNVTNKGIAYMRGLQNQGVLACAKHFPGHGDTDEDSHKTLPTIHHSKEHLDSIEFFPFKELIKNGVGSVMSAHLYVPALDSGQHASSLSETIITDILQKELGFKGLTFTDALNMKGVSKYFKPGELEVRALLAGNDVLLFPENVPRAIAAVEKALELGILNKEDINKRVKKILQLKYWCGLHKYRSISTRNLLKDLNSNYAEELNKRLIESSITLVRNKNDLIPIKDILKHEIATIAIGSKKITKFQKSFDYYCDANHYNIESNASSKQFNESLEDLSNYPLVVVSLNDMSRYAHKDFGLSLKSLGFLKKLQSNTKVIIVHFGNPYSLKYFDDANHLILAYSEDSVTQEIAAKALFGGQTLYGKLPVSSNKSFKYGHGKIKDKIRLQYGSPESVGINSRYLKTIDLICKEAVNTESTPGGQVLVAKNGVVIYNKSFGYHTYDKITKTTPQDIYDIASITKIAATTISLMKLEDLGNINSDSSIGLYLNALDTTNKKSLIMRDILIHQAGLKSWIPFYVKAMQTKNTTNFVSKSQKDFTIEVSDNFYMKNNYIDSLWNNIYSSNLHESKRYLYSDIGFYLFRNLIQEEAKMSLDRFTWKHFYRPLGLRTMCYNPRRFFPLTRIVPTEEDNIFRNGLVHGHVHDPGAAMLGGVGGHAGLFCNANDLAILMQMLLNKGNYGGCQYLSEEVVNKYTQQVVEENRRGLGFDKPDQDYYDSASDQAFGHTGFTGTCVWADPKYDLVYVFLSNRVNPSAEVNRLARTNIRTRILDAIYEAIRKSNIN